jgi:monooxygenase
MTTTPPRQSATNAPQTNAPAERNVDVLIIGAGISGISAACHLSKLCPSKDFAILERRQQLGGTWDLFRYPGIRSDSDMQTLGFRFRPWTGTKSIADGPDILQYLKDTAREHHIVDKMWHERHVRCASWVSADSTWLVEVDGPDGPEHWRANYLWMCAGYYNYDNGYTPPLDGIDAYEGLVVHPQHWPADLDCTGRRVVVIGSGATAFTLVPALAKQAEHVTMLQRSPTYVVSIPSVNRTANRLRRLVGRRVSYWLVRWFNVMLSALTFAAARRWPRQTKKLLIDAVRKQLPNGFDVERHFTPTYNPWDQRICAVPDSDFFRAIRAGAVSVVTDHIDTFTADGITLASGKSLECDVVVTATGLAVQMLGGAEVVVDGVTLSSGSLLSYKGIMYAGVPNLSVTFGYTNASWTLKADLTSEYTCRLLNHMDEVGATSATPQPGPEGVEVQEEPAFTPGYFQRAASIVPQQGKHKPWRLDENYPFDILTLRYGTVDDGVLHFARTPASSLPFGPNIGLGRLSS